MVEKTSSASLPAWLYMSRIWFSHFVVKPRQTPTTTIIVGTIEMVISVNFHCTANAIMNAVTKVDTPWTVRDSFSEIPLLTLFELVVTCAVTDPASAESK